MGQREGGFEGGGRKQLKIEIIFERSQMVNTADKESKVAIINMFKELKGSMSKELKEGMI